MPDQPPLTVGVSPDRAAGSLLPSDRGDADGSCRARGQGTSEGIGKPRVVGPSPSTPPPHPAYTGSGAPRTTDSLARADVAGAVAWIAFHPNLGAVYRGMHRSGETPCSSTFIRTCAGTPTTSPTSSSSPAWPPSGPRCGCHPTSTSPAMTTTRGT